MRDFVEVYPMDKFIDKASKLGFETPTFTKDGDAGLDIRVCMEVRDEAMLLPGRIHKISTGIKFGIPRGWCGFVKERSGLGTKFGFKLVCGVIDSGYRGEILVAFTVDEEMKIKNGDRIAQVVFLPVLTKTKTVTKLSETERGESGFGSSGVK